ncbi:MAG: DNA phosphorothioation system restriction enzyme [Synechococcus sp.]
MSLKDLIIQETYRSDDCDLVEDFYEPCLQHSTTYDRAAGYFSSSSLAAIAQGLTAFIRGGGRMRLVTSPKLSEEDSWAIAQGLKQRDEVITRTLLRSLDGKSLPDLGKQRLAALTWLLANGLLDIKLAIVPSHRGIFHEKVGIFADADGNLVTFSGSANESENALRHNFEVWEIFTSWQAGVESRARRRAQAFEDLWQNRTPKVDVIDFPEAVKRSLIETYCPSRPPTQEFKVASSVGPYNFSPSGTPALPKGLTLRSYQQQAVENWFKNKGRGTLKMATGSGKTITALAIATRLFETIELKVLLVVCPYRHLVSQWATECRKFGLKPLLAFESAQRWQENLATQLYNVRSGSQTFLTIVTTNSTLIGQRLQSQLQYLPAKTLIVGDEAHNLGARRLEESLPRNVGLRLALSATPERYFDDSGTQRIFDYFGPVLEPEFTLKDAIRAEALVHYLYYPMLVELTESEAEEYATLTAKIGRCIGLGGADAEENEALTALLVKRSRLVGAAANKLVVLRQLMQERLDTSHTLFYCGDGEVEDEVTAETRRQVEAVTRLLGKELGYRVNTYTAETSLQEREQLRQQFESGELQGLVAIRCLDEGVDIPATRTAVILASSSNPRQFIQRRGRILRRHPGKDRATLFDAIVVPPEMGEKTMEVERGLLRKELRRFVEFADLADNAGEARAHLLPLQKRYGLLDL